MTIQSPLVFVLFILASSERYLHHRGHGAGGHSLPLRVMACVFVAGTAQRPESGVGGGDRAQSIGHVKLSDKILP